ncbi:hypothetical protein B1R94_11585 [Mycolicibacterium litorale]|nr:hypothetical protein B1R94_11585 [Mycolicibacterium litorale]
MQRFRPAALAAAAVLTLAACSNPIVTTDDTGQQTAPPQATAPSTRPSNDKLVNAFDFYTRTDDSRSGYYFTSPSGSWRCVIVPRTWAGCQSSAGSLGIQGAPQSVTDDTGQTTTPTAILVRTEGDPQFAAVSAEQFTAAGSKAKTLPFNKILAAAGFRCNVQQEVGISCLSEETGNGFTFSNTGASWQYTDIP